jgi:hypothetical protein
LEVDDQAVELAVPTLSLAPVLAVAVSQAESAVVLASVVVGKVAASHPASALLVDVLVAVLLVDALVAVLLVDVLVAVLLVAVLDYALAHALPRDSRPK